MCKQFEEGLKEDIKVLVGILELKEFVVLVDRAHKAEELNKEKRKADFEFREFKDASYSVVNVGSVKDNKPDCQRYGRRPFGECKDKGGARFKCGSYKLFIHDCSELSEKVKVQNVRPSNTAVRGRPPRNLRDVSNSRSGTKDSAVRSEARAPARPYAIRAREEASTPDVITSTFSIFGTNVTTLIDPGSTHSYVCMNLVSSKNLPVKSTEFMVKVSNPLGQFVLIDKFCKNCPLMTRGYNFLADLMLFPFDEFDNGETLQIESDSLSGLPIVISAMSAQRYVRKGCDTYLAYVMGSKVSKLKIGSVHVVFEYSDVFPKELLGLPAIKEVEFAIKLVPRTSPILIAHYKMTATELKELKAQLQELIDRGVA
ncbi:uncharacterized protein LOC128039939 [Gossypium raimondii]|uniref:uncharacterized protein LOC128039939 n=1 Tax=Gossypium raimondii TaxID=29730 RepID=UPI00227B2EE4|nr:uncharacterized protein LOC128039939 [Gossypium raimondii]